MIQLLYHSIHVLYGTGARVIMACRDTIKAEEAAAEIKEEVKPQEGSPVGEVVVKKLDLASLASVRECAKSILSSEAHIHILVNNAGMSCLNFTYVSEYLMTNIINYLIYKFN